MDENELKPILRISLLRCLSKRNLYYEQFVLMKNKRDDAECMMYDVTDSSKKDKYYNDMKESELNAERWKNKIEDINREIEILTKNMHFHSNPHDMLNYLADLNCRIDDIEDKLDSILELLKPESQKEIDDEY